jgi:hypothetical protein
VALLERKPADVKHKPFTLIPKVSGTHLGESWDALASRAVIYTVLVILTATFLFITFGFPRTPCRGFVNCVTNYVVLLAFVVPVITFQLLLMLDVFAIAARNLNQRLEKNVRLTDEASILDLREELKQIADYTDQIDEFIYIPVLTLGLMVLARNTYFDDWDMPVVLVTLWGILTLYIIVAAILLRRAAEGTRRKALAALEDFFWTQGKNSIRDLTKEAIRSIEEIKHGAFASFVDLPVVRAIALPSGITAILYILDTFSTRF